MRFVRAVLEVLRLALSRERLGTEAGPPPGGARTTHGVLHVLLVSREPLGFDPERPRVRRSVLRTIFAPERLPLDPEPPAARRRGRLAALLAPERLDDDSP